MKKIAVIHYMPLEYYPPVTNFLNILAEEESIVQVWSTKNIKNRSNFSNSKLQNISRNPLPNPQESGILRLIKYFQFNISCFVGLAKLRPHTIVYYETYSAFPVYWYMKLFGTKTQLHIHFHEYFSQEWYKKGMFLVRKYHLYEQQFLFQKATNISQTNQDRIRLFLKDNPTIEKEKMLAIANYPPKIWGQFPKQSKTDTSQIQTVYVGSLSIKDTYIQEYCEWLKTQNGKVSLAIYAYNLHHDTLQYLRNLNLDYVQFYEKGVDYDQIPKILSQYHVGLILYRAKSDNYTYNAPNKLFEYLVCGLEVWYPNTMLGIKPYRSEQVKELDFERIEGDCVKISTSKNWNVFFAENEFAKLIKLLVA